MGDPAQSLFCGVELQLDTVNQQVNGSVGSVGLGLGFSRILIFE